MELDELLSIGDECWLLSKRLRDHLKLILVS